MQPTQWSLQTTIGLLLNRVKFHETAAQHIRKQLQLLKAELPLPPESNDALASMLAAGFGSHVLEDDQCEDEETEQSSKPGCIIETLLAQCALFQLKTAVTASF